MWLYSGKIGVLSKLLIKHQLFMSIREHRICELLYLQFKNVT